MDRFLHDLTVTSELKIATSFHGIALISKLAEGENHMANYKTKATVQAKRLSAEFEVAVFSFEDDGCKIVYAPALDLSGYGKSAREAIRSFEVAIVAFAEYALNKGTLTKELRKLGWKISGSLTGKTKKKVSAPPIADMVFNNDYLSDIFENKQYKKSYRSVALPV